MSFIDGVEHGRPVVFADSRLLGQARGGAVQGCPTAKVGGLRVHRFEQICLQRDATRRGRRSDLVKVVGGNITD